jgi:hypothetical protein
MPGKKKGGLAADPEERSNAPARGSDFDPAAGAGADAPTRSMMRRVSSEAELRKKLLDIVETESTPSSARAVRMLSKPILLGLTGLVMATLAYPESFARGTGIASSYLARLVLQVVGSVFLSVGMSWIELVRGECARHIFFPSQQLNLLFAILLRFEVYTVSVLVVSMSLFSWTLADFWWALVLPALIMSVTVSGGPLSFLGSGPTSPSFRVLSPELGDLSDQVQGLLQTAGQTPQTLFSQGDSFSVLLKDVPMYRLRQLAAELQPAARGFLEDAVKEGAPLPMPKGKEQPRSPMEHFEAAVKFFPEMLLRQLSQWHNRDIYLYLVIATFLFLVKAMNPYVRFTPLCLLFPLAQSSLVSRVVRDLQEDYLVHLGKPSGTGGAAPGWHELDFGRTLHLVVAHLWGVYACFVVLTGYEPIFGCGPAAWLTLAWAVLVGLLQGAGTVGSVAVYALNAVGLDEMPRWGLMLCGSLANDGTILSIARRWRLHFKHCGSAADPMDARRGFLYSLLGHHCCRLALEARAATQFIDMADLRALPEVRFQTSVDVWFRFLICYAFPTMLTLLWGEELWTAFLYVGVLRLLVVQYLTDAVLQTDSVTKGLRERSTCGAEGSSNRSGSCTGEGTL